VLGPRRCHRSESDLQNRGENVDRYITKLDDLVKKFANLKEVSAKQETLQLDARL
jgi:hypothetical protein